MRHPDDRIAWLCKAKTPSIVHQTLRDLAPRRASARAAASARQRMMRTGAVPAILSRQSKNGNWKIDFGYYGPKFYSTHWSMMLLAELGAEAGDRRFRKGGEYMLEATRKELQHSLDRKIRDWSCFWGNLLRYAVQAGLRDDPRVGEIIHLLSADIRNGFCTCRINGGLGCAWGVVRGLWGLAAVPAGARTKETDRAIRTGIQFLLEDDRLVNADYPYHPRSRINPLWFKLNFPLFYQADILFTLRVLDELSALDRRGARKALDWLESRRGKNGLWRGSSPERRRTWKEMGGPEETNRWVTLQALRILRHAGRSVSP